MCTRRAATSIPVTRAIITRTFFWLRTPLTRPCRAGLHHYELKKNRAIGDLNLYRAGQLCQPNTSITMLPMAKLLLQA